MIASRHRIGFDRASALGNSRAFTLIEVLLAVAIFGIVLLAIHGVFYGAVRLRNKTVTALEAAVPLQQTLTILRRDLANVVVPGGTLFGELQSTPTGSVGSDQTQPNSFSMAGSGASGATSPVFYTAVGIIDDTAHWGEVQKVRYFLADPTNQTVGRDLFRSVTRNLLPTLQEEPIDQWLMSGVEDLAFFFYDGTQWRDSWDSTAEETKLPRAVKVELQLAVPERNQALPPPLELVVPLFVQARTNQTEEATGGEP